MEEKRFDLVIIGSGPAGVSAAFQGAKLGKSVVIIESGELGGGFLSLGTIPSKSLRENILNLTNYFTKSFYAEESCAPKKVSIKDLNYPVNFVIERHRKTLKEQLTKNKVQIVNGWATFLDENRLVVKKADQTEVVIEAETILISTGSSPRESRYAKFDGEVILDSNQLLHLEEIPNTLIVVGGGVIGIEYASMFALLGTKVTVLDKRENILGFLDQEIRIMLQAALEEKGLGISFQMNKEIEKVSINDGRGVVKCSDGNEYEGEKVLIASGRKANIENLGIENTNVKKDGEYLIVDQHFQTSQPNIYAVGDVIGGYCLASTALIQGRLAIRHAYKRESLMFHQVFPFGLYTIPEVSFIGKTEEELKAENIVYEVGRAYSYEVSRWIISGEKEGICKILFAVDTKELLGVHILGRAATEMIHVAQVAMDNHVTINYFINQVFNIPTYAEMFRIAAMNGLNKCSKSKVKGSS